MYPVLLPCPASFQVNLTQREIVIFVNAAYKEPLNF